MSRLLLLALLMYAVTAESCIIQDKKGKPDIRVIELDDSSKESGESETVELHLPDRRKREIVDLDSQKGTRFCKNDDDCSPGLVCLAYLTCVKGTWRSVNFPEAKVTN